MSIGVTPGVSSATTAEIARLYNRVNSPTKIYPSLTNSVSLTTGTPAETLGSFIEIIPASTITNDFDILFIDVGGISADTNFEIVLYAGTTEIARQRVSPRSTSLLPQIKISAEIVPANTQIQAKVASDSGNADIIDVTIIYVDA